MNVSVTMTMDEWAALRVLVTNVRRLREERPNDGRALHLADLGDQLAELDDIRRSPS